MSVYPVAGEDQAEVMSTSTVGPGSLRPARLAAVEVPRMPMDSEIGDELDELEAVSRNLETHTLSANTRRAYAKAWRSFSAFCRAHGLESLPAHPETVRWYVAWMSTQAEDTGTGLPRFSVSTIRQYLAGVADEHLRQGYLDPTAHRAVGDLVRGLAKLRATRPERKRPLLLDDVVRIIEAMQHRDYPVGVSATRDAAALWLGFAGALRRSEAGGLLMTSVELHPQDGVHLRIGRSKTDQDNTAADVVVLPFGTTPRTCAPCALHRWIALVQDTVRLAERAQRQAIMSRLYAYQLQSHVCGADDGQRLIEATDPILGQGPLLRATYRNRRAAQIQQNGITGDALHTMLHTRMTEAGMNPSAYGFHSLRAGHVTQARRNGASTEEIMRAGRWQRAETVNVYDREYNPAARNSVMSLGL